MDISITTVNEKFALEAAERVAGKLNELIKQGHETPAFLMAILLAAFKDCLDLGLNIFLIAELPIIGQLPGIFLTATLFLFLWGKGWFNSTKVKIILWVLGFFFSNIPILNAAPITVLTVLMAWHVVRKKARKAEDDLKDLKEKTIEELEEIEKETES